MPIPSYDPTTLVADELGIAVDAVIFASGADVDFGGWPLITARKRFMLSSHFFTRIEIDVG